MIRYTSLGNMDIRCKVFIFTFSLLLGSNLVSQAQFNFQFENLDTQGLANGNINSILEDSEGFLWVGTGQGLYRYDGYKFRLFLIDPGNTKSLSANSIYCLYEDHLKKIWIGTSAGLFRFDPGTEVFQSFEVLTEKYKISISVESIHQDSKDNIWFTTETTPNRVGGLIFYDQLLDRFETFNFGLLGSKRTILNDDNNNFWIACDQGIVIFDPNSKTIIKHIDILFPSLTGNDIGSLYKEKEGVIWATSKNEGIARIDYDNSYNLSFRNFGVENGFVSNKAISMTKDGKGNYWVATMDGIVVFNSIHNTLVNLKPSDNDPYSLRSIRARSIFEDKSGNIWIGHSGSGLSKVKYNRGFITIPANTGGAVQLSGKSITSVYADPFDNLWAATLSQGVHKINFKSNFHRPPEVAFYPFPNAQISSMEKHSVASMLLADERGGLCLLDELTGQIKHIAANSSSMVRKLKDGILFVSEGRSLNKALESNSTYHIEKLVPDSSPAKTLIQPEYSSFTEENKNLYWLSTWQGDLYFYNNENNTFTLPKRNPYEVLRISRVHVDKKKFLWLTAFEGVFKYKIERKNNAITLNLENKYTEKDGLITKEGASNLFTASMAEDDKGNIWLGQVGLTVLNPETGKVRTYYEEDGLPGNDMSITESTKMKNGYLVFGTNRGLFLFHPDSLKDNVHIPPIVITDFTVLNKPGPKLIEPKELQYFENVITFEFSALDFTAPLKNQYAYQMIGFDQDWIYSGNRRTATYTNLDPGTYTFRAKGSNNDGVWNDEGTSIKIVILPPPWKTWWAYAIYGLGFVLLLVAARYETIKRERLRNEFKLKQVEADKFHELDVMKSRFFANISHEFRTPLTLILGPLEKRLSEVTEPADKTELTVMHRNASRLLVLVNQLLDLSRVEAGQLKLNCQFADLHLAIQSIASQFSSMADSKGIQFQVRANEPVALFFDPEKLEKIVNNLLSNAFKFTPAGGSIALTLNQQPPNEKFKNGFAEIIVADTGIGIEPDDLPKIFDRFYQADTSSTRAYEGTGIGLALTKELVELHQGIIQVTSTPGQGSCFTVQLPMGTAHLKEGEIEYAPAQANQTVNLTQGVPEAEEHEIESAEISMSKVLIVEDNADLRYYLRTNLSDRYAIHEASDGAEGLAIALKEVPDLVISDLMMPKMDGIQLCHQLKKDERTSHIPVILLTAKVDQDTKIEGLEIGADDYIAKPFNMTELNARIKGIIDNRKKLQEKYANQLRLRPQEIKVASVDDRFLKRVLEIIELHIGDTSFSVDVLATEAALSSAQLYRKLKALTNHTPNDLIRDMRLTRAASLFQQHAGNVAEVAYQVGFNNLSYFAKCFKEKYNSTPSEFVKLAQ